MVWAEKGMTGQLLSNKEEVLGLWGKKTFLLYRG